MNEAQWQNRMTMLVNSCDAYEDLWQPFFTLLKRYFAPLDMRILLNTESKDFRFEGLNIECVHSSAATYGERMTDALRRVKTEYTLLMLDDFFLREPVKMDRLHDLVRWMDADRDIVYFSSDITEALCKGENCIELLVANTQANELGQRAYPSGRMGEVKINEYEE